MFDTIIETIKTVGSFAGFLTALFLIWDRFIKNRPVALIVARPLVPESRRILHFLYVKNVSDRPILVSWQNRSEKNRLRIGKDQTISGIVDVMHEDETIVSLGPKAEAYLPLIRPGNYAEIDPDNLLEVTLRW